MAFQPIFPPFKERPPSQGAANPFATLLVLIRDNFSISTWLLLGAFVQGVLSFLPYPNIAVIAPVAMILLYQATRTTLQCFKVFPNPRMDEVIPGRTAALYPDANGIQDRPAEKKLCAIILGIRCNHPLGMFVKDFYEVGKYFDEMSAELEKHATRYGYLGSSSWISAADRGYASEKMSLHYFESADKLHEYAQGPIHTKGMQWWTQAFKEIPHIGLMHEILEAPAHGWEGLYMNYAPTGLGATWKEVDVDGKKVWMNPLVRAKGPLLWSKGRMGRDGGAKDWPDLHDAAIQEEGVALFKG